MNATTKDRRGIYLIGVAVIWGAAAYLVFIIATWPWEDNYSYGLVEMINWWPQFPSRGVILEFSMFLGIATGAPVAHGLLIRILGAENVKATAPWYGWVYLGILIAIVTPLMGLILYYGGTFAILFLANLIN